MKTQASEVAVQVAREALRAGDAESIADAHVGLAAHGLEGHLVYQQLAQAAAALDPTQAVLNTTGQGAFLELLVGLWRRGRLDGVAFGFEQLGLETSEAQIAQLDAALKTVNGKRRTELLEPADVVSMVLDVRGQVTMARRPPDDRRWRERESTRSVCTCERLKDGNVRLELGTERVRSYVTSSRATTAVCLTLATAPPPAAPVTSSPADVPALRTNDATTSLPNDLRTQFMAILRGMPSQERFHQALSALAGLAESPHRDAAIALVERFVALWPDDLRAPRWSFQPQQLGAPLRPLLRALEASLGTLVEHAGRGPWPEIRSVCLLDYELGETKENPDVLAAFPSLERLSLREPQPEEMAAAIRLRLPKTLGRVDLHGSLPWSATALEAMAQNLAECPALTRVDVKGGAVGPLAGLPSSVEFGLALARKDDAMRASQQLGQRSLAVLALSTWAGAAEEVHRAGLPSKVARLEVSLGPGDLEALLRGAKWPRLRQLKVTLPVMQARMHRLKPPDYSFTRGDVEALASLEVLGQLEVLDLTGVLGEVLAEVLVEALVRTRPKLVQLALTAAEVGNHALAMLADEGLLAGVLELELFRCKLKANGLTAILGERGPRSLSKLVLAKNAATLPAIEALSAWPGLASVRRLDLREVPLSAEQRSALEASSFLRPGALDITECGFWS